MARDRSQNPPESDGTDAGEFFSLADTPTYLLRLSYQRSLEIFAEEVGPMRPRHFVILLTVNQNEGINQTELARRTGIDRSTTADMVARLASRGLLRREHSGRDHRANNLWITPQGLALVRDAIAPITRVQERVMAAIPAADREIFIRCLRRLADMSDDGPNQAAGHERETGPQSRRAEGE